MSEMNYLEKLLDGAEVECKALGGGARSHKGHEDHCWTNEKIT